ncbi:glycerate kinase [soil metagenome]
MSIIRNKDTILRYHNCKSLRDSLNALDYAFKNSDPENLVSDSIHIGSDVQITDINNKIHKFDLPGKESTLVISVGKASEKMLVGFLNKMSDRIKKTILIIPIGYELRNKNLELLDYATVIHSSHPIPNGKSTFAARKVVEELQNRKGIQLIVFLISGGSSSLMVSPIDGINLADKKIINRLLITSGANIREINIVRKHISQIKGGRILRWIDPYTPVIGLILSDVVGDHLDTIGSGLTSSDKSSFKEALSILNNFSILDHKSESISKVKVILESGIRSELPETLKPKEFRSRNVTNIIIGNNSKFCRLIQECFKRRGYTTNYMGSNYGISMNDFIKIASKIINSNLKPKTCIILGGEVTNKLIGKKIGIGGRNQEAICDILQEIKNYDLIDFSVICIGTDGIDGNSTSAGGFITPKTIERLKSKKYDVNYYLRNNNTNVLLTKLHSNIDTGYTGANFNDVYLFVRNN